MKIFEDYRELLNLCFSKPPRIVPEACMEIMEQYPVDIVSVTKNGKTVACCIVTKIHDGFYGISWVAVHPDFQRQGWGQKLLNKVHKKYKGVFITKTRDAEGFYKKLKYTTVFKDNDHTILVFVNDKRKVDF